MDEGTIWAVIRDWWAFGVFVGGGVIAFLLGKERQRFRIDELARRMKELDADVQSIKRQTAAEAISLAEIRVELRANTQALTDLRNDLKGKADR